MYLHTVFHSVEGLPRPSLRGTGVRPKSVHPVDVEVLREFTVVTAFVKFRFRPELMV